MLGSRPAVEVDAGRGRSAAALGAFVDVEVRSNRRLASFVEASCAPLPFQRHAKMPAPISNTPTTPITTIRRFPRIVQSFDEASRRKRVDGPTSTDRKSREKR